MRASVLLLAAAFCCGSVHAAVPHEINYQGYLTNPGGTPVNASVTMTLNLYNVATGGTALYTEQQMVTVTNGVFNILIGPQQAAQFLLLAFDVPYYLGIMVAPDVEMTPRQPIAASAYAIRAASAEAATKLATARTINGVAFDGTGNIAVPGGVPSLTGLALGTVTAPTISFAADAATGIFSPGANQIALAAGGGLLLHNRGTNNFAAGISALSANTTGYGNVAVGTLALWANTTGSDNLAAGTFALVYNDGGSRNMATGSNALVNNITGNDNVAVGFNALNGNASGGGNVAAGSNALLNSSGNNNIAIGSSAGVSLTTGSNNIAIGHAGVAGETSIIRIGTAQTDTYLTGVVHGNGSGLTGVTGATVANGSITSAKLASSLTLAGTTSGSFSGPLAGNVTGNVTGSAASFTGALAGDVTGTQGATAIAASTVTGKSLTGFVSGAGTIGAGDTILTAINKLNGNVALKAPLASPQFTGSVGIGTAGSGSPLTVAGVIESTSGGVKFPDGTIQTTAATAPACVLADNRYIDCGDGTLTDRTTGLMWEKKTACGAVNLADPHCVFNTYTWSATSPYSAPTGTLYTDFLPKLNSHGDGTTVAVGAESLALTTCFAGHCDWRIPDIYELRSILLAPYFCGVSPCISAAFGTTVPYEYWSSSSVAGYVNGVWTARFNDGLIQNIGKNSGFVARAVRSGR